MRSVVVSEARTSVRKSGGSVVNGIVFFYNTKIPLATQKKNDFTEYACHVFQLQQAWLDRTVGLIDRTASK